MKPLLLLRLLLATSALVFSGCVTRGYKLADASVPPAVPLNLTSIPAAATLQTVIVYRGPGSWKREAYWDEYVLSLTNPGEKPLVLTTASLHDGQSEPLAPSDHPWRLERLSKTWWENNALRQTGTYFALGAGTVVGFGAAWSAAWGTMFGGTVSSGVATAGAVGTVAMVALPIMAGGTIYMNIHRRHQVEAEFARRRLVLPLTLAPGQTVQGSLFFRVTPSPQRLALRGQAGDEPHEAIIDLAPLAGLHLKAPASPAPATVAPTEPR